MNKPGIESTQFKLLFKDSHFKNEPLFDFNPYDKDPAWREGYAEGFSDAARFFIKEEIEKQLTDFYNETFSSRS